MKKAIIGFIIFLAIISIVLVSYADENPLTVTANKKHLSQNDYTVTLTVSLGAFTDIPDDAILSYEAVLEYDNEIFASVEENGLNGWTAVYEPSTKKIVGESVRAAQENTDITSINLSLYSNSNPGDTTVTLKNIKLNVNGTTTNYTIDELVFPIIITATNNENEIEKEIDNEADSQNGDEMPLDFESEKIKTITINGDLKGENTYNLKDDTIANKTMPKTGIKKMAFIGIAGAMVTVVWFLGYKNIVIK